MCWLRRSDGRAFKRYLGSVTMAPGQSAARASWAQRAGAQAALPVCAPQDTPLCGALRVCGHATPRVESLWPSLGGSTDRPTQLHMRPSVRSRARDVQIGEQSTPMPMQREPGSSIENMTAMRHAFQRHGHPPGLAAELEPKGKCKLAARAARPLREQGQADGAETAQ